MSTAEGFKVQAQPVRRELKVAAVLAERQDPLLGGSGVARGVSEPGGGVWRGSLSPIKE